MGSDNNGGNFNQTPTVRDVVVPTFGYLIVASVCSLAGLSLAIHTLKPNLHQFLSILFFLILVLPVYINRVTLYEQKNLIQSNNAIPNQAWIKKFSIQLPMLLSFIFLLLIFLFVYVLSQWPLTSPTIPSFGKLFLSVIPFYILAAWRTSVWPHNQKVFYFRFRSFFPALVTCLISFMYGWSLSSGIGGLILATLLILCYLLISLILKGIIQLFVAALSVTVMAVLSFLSSYGFLNYPPYSQYLQICTFGVLMTLIMGVSESWRVTSRIREKLDYTPPGVYYGHSPLDFHVAGTNIATCLFLPIFPLTFLYPATNMTYMEGTTLFLIAQYLTWYKGLNKHGYGYWYTVGLLFGLLLPILVAIGVTFNNSSPDPLEIIELGTLGDPLGTLAVSGAFLAYFGRTQLWSAIFPKFKLESFLRFPMYMSLTGSVAAGLLILVGFGFLFSGKFNPDMKPFFIGRLRSLQLLYAAVDIICFLSLFIYDRNLAERSTTVIRTGSDE